jgi:two-component system, chemotaxis family, response regulator Rcp1
MHMLVIEDNLADVRLLGEALRESAEAFQVSVVEDGELALAFVRREGAYTTAERPDLILLDLNLPKTDGRDVLQVLRASPEWKSIPIMILTGVLQESDQAQAAALGVERFLQKPIELEGYQALVEDITTWWKLRPRAAPS